MPIRSVTLRILGESRSARAEMDWVNREADKLNKKKVTVDVEANTPKAKLAALRIQLEGLQNMHTNINVDVNDKASQLIFARINQQLVHIDRVTAKPKISTEGLAKAQAELAAADLGFVKLMKSVDNFSKDAEVQSTRVGRLFTRGGGGFGAFGAFFGGKFALFGGVATIGTLHLLVDVLAEVLAVWIPATIAATAFGIAASDAAKNVFTHMKNLHIVMDATNRVIPPMTGNMEKLHEAVRPAVYQVFGDALTIMNAKTGIFQKLALGTAGVVTHLAARMTVAINSSHGFGEFLKNAVPDLAKIGDAFGNLFGIIGNILHVMPGYAVILLSFGDALLKLVEDATRVLEPVIGLGLAVHGFIVWAGLGASAAFFLGKAIIYLGATSFGATIKTFGVFIADLVTITLTEGLATGATFAFSGALAAIGAVNPLIWVGAAIGGLAALVFWMSRSKSATEKWGDALQKNIDNASSVTQGFQLTQSALTITSNRLGAAAAKLANTQKYQMVTNLHTGESTRVLTRAYADQQGIVDGLTTQQRRFAAEQSFNAGRLHGLTKAYGSQGNAMALLNAAGVTQQEWQTKGAEGWAIITQKINGTLAGYKAMGQTQGTLANDLQVMDRGITDQYVAMQKLNSAWDQFIGDVTGTQNSFDTAALGLVTLAANFDKANKSGHTTSHTLGEVHSKVTITHAAIDGLSQSSLALNQAFTQQVGNTNALIDTWRTAGISNNLFTRGVKDSIAPLVRYARGSQEATSQLVALAQEAGYNGPASMKSLVKWLGNTHNSLRTVKNITNQATTQEALLTAAMQAQGKYISGTLLRLIDQAIIKYAGVTAAATNYGKAIAQYGRDSTQAQAAQKVLTDRIITAGVKTHSTTGEMAALITKLTGIPKNVAIRIVETGVGNFGITGAPGHELPHHRPTGRAASGLFINQGTGPTADDVLIKASRGELVVPTRLVNAGAVDHLRGMIPGFAQGGWVKNGPSGVFTGQAAVNFNRDFINQFTGAMESAMTAAMKAAIKAQANLQFAGGGALGGSAAANRAIAMRMFPWPQSMWPAFNYLEMREAGYSLTATNPTSGAYGVAQFINGPGEYAQYGGNSTTAGGQFTGMFNYIRQRYGNPVNAASHERAFNWYHAGTRGALPGWAWVGERGPELVNMSGGETVLDAQSSKVVTRGYAKGTELEILRGISLMRDLKHDTSLAKLWGDMHHFLRIISDYSSGGREHYRRELARKQYEKLVSIDRRIHDVRGNVRAEKAYQASTFTNLSGYGALSGLELGPTAGIGDNVALSGGQGLKFQLQQKLTNMRAFGAALKKLHKMGITNNLFRQIVDMGPDQGLPYANELISGGPSFLKQLAGLEHQLKRSEKDVSQGAASSVFGTGYQTGDAYWRGLKNQERDLDKMFRRLGRTLGEEAAKWFRVPRGRRPRGFAKGGMLTEQVWGFGLSGQQYTFGEEGAEFFSPMRTPHYSGAGMGGGNIYVTVNGDSDPDAAAMRIVQKIRDFKRHHGNQSTGIG